MMSRVSLATVVAASAAVAGVVLSTPDGALARVMKSTESEEKACDTMTLMKTTGNPNDSGGAHNTGRWTEPEVAAFKEHVGTSCVMGGIRVHFGKDGRQGWKSVADHIKTRTVAQVRSHAQKYFKKLDEEREQEKGVDAEEVAENPLLLVMGENKEVAAQFLHMMKTSMMGTGRDDGPGVQTPRKRKNSAISPGGGASLNGVPTRAHTKRPMKKMRSSGASAAQMTGDCWVPIGHELGLLSLQQQPPEKEVAEHEQNAEQVHEEREQKKEVHSECGVGVLGLNESEQVHHEEREQKTSGSRSTPTPESESATGGDEEAALLLLMMTGNEEAPLLMGDDGKVVEKSWKRCVVVGERFSNANDDEVLQTRTSKKQCVDTSQGSSSSSSQRANSPASLSASQDSSISPSGASLNGAPTMTYTKTLMRTPGKPNPFGGIQHGKWTTQEHVAFLEGLNKFGLKSVTEHIGTRRTTEWKNATGLENNEWKNVTEHIGTRTSEQVRSHAQKYFANLKKDTNGNPPNNVLPPMHSGPSSSGSLSSTVVEPRELGQSVFHFLVSRRRRVAAFQ